MGAKNRSPPRQRPTNPNIKKNRAAIKVGITAPAARPSGETESLKNFPRIETPAGLGALAMTVRPPPVTAPATTAYFISGVRLGTSEARYVMAALSLKAVRTVAPQKS